MNEKSTRRTFLSFLASLPIVSWFVKPAKADALIEGRDYFVDQVELPPIGHLFEPSFVSTPCNPPSCSLRYVHRDETFTRWWSVAERLPEVRNDWPNDVWPPHAANPRSARLLGCNEAGEVFPARYVQSSDGGMWLGCNRPVLFWAELPPAPRGLSCYGSAH